MHGSCHKATSNKCPDQWHQCGTNKGWSQAENKGWVPPTIVGLLAQARDTALLKRKRRANSDLRRSDSYLEKEKEDVVVVTKRKL
jgi:hypothetical protein